MQLAFEEFGAVDNPSLVVLHGFFASARNWRQIARMLAGRYHVLVPDLRNHGASPHDAVMDYPAMAADIVDFILQRQLQQVHLLGHSMGGKVAMWLALNEPERAQSLIVVDIAPARYRHSFDNLITALRGLSLQDIGNRREAEQLLENAIPDRSFRQFLLQNLVLKDGHYHWRIDLEIFQRAAPAIIGFPDVQKVQPFDKKTLFLAGGTSHYLRSEDQPVIDRLFPAAEVVRLPDTGHWLHAEQPALFVAAVEKFLAE